MPLVVLRRTEPIGMAVHMHQRDRSEFLPTRHDLLVELRARASGVRADLLNSNSPVEVTEITAGFLGGSGSATGLGSGGFVFWFAAWLRI